MRTEPCPPGIGSHQACAKRPLLTGLCENRCQNGPRLLPEGSLHILTHSVALALLALRPPLLLTAPYLLSSSHTSLLELLRPRAAASRASHRLCFLLRCLSFGDPRSSAHSLPSRSLHRAFSDPTPPSLSIPLSLLCSLASPDKLQAHLSTVSCPYSSVCSQLYPHGL